LVIFVTARWAASHQTTLTYHAIVAAADDSVPVPVRLIANPVRWRLLRELARGDQRVRELVAAVGEPQNLVSYHLRRLRAGGLVTARRSSFDGRDTYYSLDLAGCADALAGTAACAVRMHRQQRPLPHGRGAAAPWRRAPGARGERRHAPQAPASDWLDLLSRRASIAVDGAAGVGPDRLHRVRRAALAHPAASAAVRGTARLAGRARVRGRDRRLQCAPRAGLHAAGDLLRLAAARPLGALVGGAAFIVPGLIVILALAGLYVAKSASAPP